MTATLGPWGGVAQPPRAMAAAKPNVTKDLLYIKRVLHWDAGSASDGSSAGVVQGPGRGDHAWPRLYSFPGHCAMSGRSAAGSDRQQNRQAPPWTKGLVL